MGDTSTGELRGKIPGNLTGIEIRPTICSICNVSTHCGIDAYVKDGVVVKVEGTQANPSSQGGLCIKGASSRQYIYHADRISTPLVRRGDKGAGTFEPISWDSALDLIGEKLDLYKAESGPESVVFGVGFTKWMRPFLKRLALNFGSPNYVTESCTCYLAGNMAYRLNYGDFCGGDLSSAKCLLAWSYNPFYSKNAGNIRGLLDARDRGLKIIDVGPLVTPLSRMADIHLRIRPGTSGALAWGMANVIIEEGLYDREFVENWTTGFPEFADMARSYPLERVENITGVPADLIRKAARMYAETSPATMMTSASSTTHHTNGLQNHRALTALIGLTGNWDVPGGNVVDSETWIHVPAGVPTYADEFEHPRDRKDLAERLADARFPVWREIVDEAQGMAMPHQVLSGKPYPIRAMLGFGINHRMWPGSDHMLESLKKLDFFVNMDLFMTDTCRFADLVLPACTSFERSELKFYGQRYVIWTQPAIAPVGQARSDVEVICDIARRIIPDDPLLTKGHEACIEWILEPSGLKLSELKKHPAGMTIPNPVPLTYRKYRENGFNTPSGKMEFRSTILEKHGQPGLPEFVEPEQSPVSTPEIAQNFPLILTTGARVPMLIHSRTARLPWIRKLRPYPVADINPVDASARGISQNDEMVLSTPRAAIRLRANLTETTPPGVVNLYHGQLGIEVNHLFDPDYLDPISGFPGFKSALCNVAKA